MSYHFVTTIHDETGETVLTIDTYSVRRVIEDLEKFEKVKEAIPQQPILDAQEYRLK